MYSAIPPYVLNFAAFSLIVVCLIAGQSPKLFHGLSIVSLNATDWKTYVIDNYTEVDFGKLEDVYRVYMTTHCDGYKAFDKGKEKIHNVTCSKPASYGTSAKSHINDGY